MITASVFMFFGALALLLALPVERRAVVQQRGFRRAVSGGAHNSAAPFDPAGWNSRKTTRTVRQTVPTDTVMLWA